MEKLRRLSLKGWHVCDFKFMGYILEKGESSDYIYCIDYRSLEDGEEEEYFDLFFIVWMVACCFGRRYALISSESRYKTDLQ